MLTVGRVVSEIDDLTYEQLGFQSQDHPERDIRGGGLLVALNFIYLLEMFETAGKGKELIELSMDEVHGFPLALASFEITVKALKRVREGKFDPKK